jgi:hypothetical protein
LIKRESQNLAIRNLTLTLFTIKLVRILNNISLNNDNECVTYFNIIANLQTNLFKRIKFRRRAEDKVLHEFYQIMRETISELKNL